MNIRSEREDNSGKHEALFDIASYRVYMTLDHALRWNSGTWKKQHKMWIHDPDTDEYIELSDYPEIKDDIEGVQAVQLEPVSGMFGYQIRWKV